MIFFPDIPDFSRSLPDSSDFIGFDQNGRIIIFSGISPDTFRIYQYFLQIFWLYFLIELMLYTFNIL